MKDKEKAIRWFGDIADECDKLTSGNVAHLRTQIKGMAIRSAEYLTKHSQEPASEDLERCVVEQMEADGDVDDFVRRGIDDIALKYAALGAQWQREGMMKDAISGFIFGSRYFRQKNISLTNLSEEQYDKLKDFGERVKVIIIKE